MNGQPTTTALCDYAASNWEETGVMRYMTPTRMGDVTDGASNTLLVGDKRLNLSKLGQPQNDDDTGYATGFDFDVIRKTAEPPAPDYRAPTGDGGGLFGSSHIGRFNVVFADGSVHSLPYTIDPIVFNYLGNRSDGQAISSADY